ncbi:unnamed protein product [Ceutorhynchus assimilis]|uniref:Uncharacterized protein n=1 Tax=Ceutorhynchus assimilis TaxID=467358 RepID=A0A9N9MW23_9CUCU|nr:unnamed protein product [Ceutorhynchus assimilis]
MADDKKIYTAEEIQKIAPRYRGKPENFNPSKIGQKKPATVPKGKRNAEIPPPTDAHHPPTAQRNDSIISEAIFGVEVSVTEIAPRQSFAANYSKLIDIVTETYAAYQADEKVLDRIIAREEVSYYATAMLDLKLLEVKAKQGDAVLTSAEKDMRKSTVDETFNVPQTILTYLKEVGTYTDRMGKETRHEVPNLPTTVVQNFGGYHAQEVNADNHCLFEEVPSLGIAGDMGTSSKYFNYFINCENGNIEIEETIREGFLSDFFSVKVTYIEVFEQPNHNTSTPNLARSFSGGNVQQARLPKIEIPKCKGDYRTFVTCLDLFNAQVHINPNLSDIERFNYLLSVLEDPPLSLVAHTFIADNYLTSYDTLEQRYSNGRLRAQEHWIVPVEHDMILNFSDHFKQLIKSAPKGPKKEKFAISTYRIMRYTKNNKFIECSDLRDLVQKYVPLNDQGYYNRMFENITFDDEDPNSTELNEDQEAGNVSDSSYV